MIIVYLLLTIYDNFKGISNSSSSDQLNNQSHFDFGHILFRFDLGS